MSEADIRAEFERRQKDMPEKVLPELEFEGPMGMFWLVDEVPIECLEKAKNEIQAEIDRRQPH
jgi:hypothetical protein